MMAFILELRLLSSAAGRVDRSTRARFWDMYKAEAEEFHADFLRKYNSELDISLIFVSELIHPKAPGF